MRSIPSEIPCDADPFLDFRDGCGRTQAGDKETARVRPQARLRDSAGKLEKLQRIRHILAMAGLLDFRICAKCGAAHWRKKQSYCHACHAAAQREWRKTVIPTEEQRRKDISRSYAGVYKRRWAILQEDCERCGSPNSEMHHKDYSRPIDVVWLCRPCHLNLHAAE